MTITKIFKESDSKAILDNIITDPNVLELLKNNKSFLTANEYKNATNVVSNLKLIFDNIKQVALRNLEEVGFETPSIYFLITPFFLEDENGDIGTDLHSMTISLRAKFSKTQSIKLKRSVTFDNTFDIYFKQTITDFFSLIIKEIVAYHNVEVLNKTIISGAHLYYDLDTDLQDIDFDSIESVYDDLQSGILDFQKNGLIVPQFQISNFPIVSISSEHITLGVSDYSVTTHIGDSSLTKISDFLYQYAQAKQTILESNESLRELELQIEEVKSRNVEEEEEKSEEDVENRKTLSDAFYGLDSFFEEEEEKINPLEIELENLNREYDNIKNLIGDTKYNLIMSFIPVQPIVESLYSKLIASDTPIQFLVYYPQAIMELVSTQPTPIRTQRISPLFKDSFYTDEDYFHSNVDNGFLFTYVKGHKVRTPLGLKLEPENAFHGTIIRKVDGVEQSVGLDNFFMNKLAKIAKVEV